jgi:acetoin utilization protein AcuB
MRVKEIMSRPVVTIKPAASCLTALRQMRETHVRHLAVVDNGGALVGMVTDRDLRHHLFTPAAYRELGVTGVDTLLARASVRDVMSSPPFCVGADGELAEAAQRMREHRVGSLAVVDGRRLVGIITETDLLRHLCRLDASTAADVAEIVVHYP